MSISSRPTAVGEAVELALYNFDAFKTKKKEDPPKPEVTLLAGSAAEETGFKRGRILGRQGRELRQINSFVTLVVRLDKRYVTLHFL